MQAGWSTQRWRRLVKARGGTWRGWPCQDVCCGECPVVVASDESPKPQSAQVIGGAQAATDEHPLPRQRAVIGGSFAQPTPVHQKCFGIAHAVPCDVGPTRKWELDWHNRGSQISQELDRGPAGQSDLLLEHQTKHRL